MGRAFEYRKARMFKRWGNMSKTFTRISKEIIICVKAGGPDPTSNPRLRVLMQNARAANMPKDTVERSIKKASSKDQADIKEHIYEGYGPHGIAILVESATDNPTRTVAAVRSYFNRFGGTLATTGSVSFQFEHKCLFKVQAKPGIDLEELELEMIDVGAQEIFDEEGSIIISGEFEDYGNIQKYLEDNDFEIISVDIEWIATQNKELTEEEAAEVEKLLARLEEDDDVTNVFHNMTIAQ
ncbi:MAG: YebC/PmpR family DNA-binding transcriptional regulator [Bacteroidales bacterium]|jgi:YebC/PmpR family DNA-binding regulatory protein|nr:YebC/PmpR family DNA-binding transcriptional regulator [Bacteroidales bacterium]MDD2571325.1 YebC/PmpR family DNA-binding transcriptional regulator [Bacteroidales bacterium]MDD2812343.1 YebC/PmpR family DNA-binding transcriptional regulator [Bacteroidales bacterium]MDD3385865.1 YebC/PmpR family DNA-binding transcriptional regulator [Bacteroidales bacterium]MDD3811623.1 YebC/PmpR family DNA-binding transcriptional regulator [Bacteroidales bacterium]